MAVPAAQPAVPCGLDAHPPAARACRAGTVLGRGADGGRIATDSRHGLIRTWEVSSAAAPDGKHLKGLLSKQDAASSVWADTACRSKANEVWMARNGFTSQIHHRKPPKKDLPAPLVRANARRSRVRSAVEHVLADRKQRMALLVRTIGLRRARIKIGMVNLACTMRRFVRLGARAAPA